MRNHRCSSLRKGLTLAALTALVLAPQAWAAKPGQGGPQEIIPDGPEASFQRGNARVSAETGVPLALYRVDHRVAPGNPEAMATQFLQERAAALGLESPGLSDLVFRTSRRSPAGDTVRFLQHVEGVRVYGSEIAVTVDASANVDFVASGYKPGVRVPTTVPTLDAVEALERALGYLEAQGELIFERTELVVYHRRGASRLAWEVRVVADSPTGDWEALVDAHSGSIFRVEDKALHVDGDGDVYDPDPLSSSGASYGDPGYTDGGDADTTQLLSQHFNRVLRDLDFDGANYHLNGPFAAIDDSENPKNGLFSQSSPSFLFTRNQSGFEAANCYYHIDTVMRYLNVDLGLNIMPFQYSGGAQYDPHGLNGADNAHYTPSTGRIAFGEGGVDDAEDADVVIHELGHGLHDWVTGGGLSQNEGLSEGTGDYVAQSYSRSLGQWTPADTEYQWVFNWDGHNEFWGGRTTGYGASYPGGLVGQVHTDGQIWSTCNMKIWDLLGPQKTDRAFWSGLGMTGGNTNQQDAAQAVLDAAVNLGYSGADVATMEATYQGCGYNVTAQCASTCGNGTIECNEVCDGGDLGGATCTSQGCSGGTLACNGSCDGFDNSACTGCAVCDNDGVCELGEDCNGCPSDCVSGTSSGGTCGNGLCEAGDGENCTNCAQDCNGQQGGKPSGRFCCGDGGGQSPLPCSDPTCSTGGWSCTDTPSGGGGTFCCGDLSCDSGESCSNCGLDCATGAELCADGLDNDCDGATDCNDGDCAGDPACSCGPKGAACTVNTDCCSNACKNNGTCR